MPTKPAVEGLLKHQLYIRDPYTGREQSVVLTFWTWKNEDPVAPARITYEQGALKAWARSATFQARFAPGIYATWLKSWDMGQTPPQRAAPVRIWPIADGTNSPSWSAQLCGIIALRTQAVGSEERNRQNGRLFHPFLHVGSMASGLMSTAVQTDLTTLYNQVLAVLKPAADPVSGTWVVPSWREGNAPRVGGPLLPAVNHILVRRMPGVRRSHVDNQPPYAVGS